MYCMGVSQDDLVDVYYKQVRSILEFAVPVWHSSITNEERINLERIQKSACYIKGVPAKMQVE